MTESGTSDLRVVDVAKRASVGVPTIYYHFESRTQLIAEAQLSNYLALLEPLHGCLTRAEAALEAGDREGYVDAIGDNLVLAWKAGQHGDRWGVVRLLLDVWSDPKTQARFCTMLELQFTRWIGLAERAKALGWVDPSLDGAVLLATFWSATIGQVITSSSHVIDPSPESIRDFFLRSTLAPAPDEASLRAVRD